MKIRNDFINSGKKIIHKKGNYTKLNLKRNLNTLDDPAFHLNRTLKQYINYKLNKNSCENNIRETKNTKNLSKFKDNNKSFSRSQTFSNIIKSKKVFPIKKIKKSKIINYLSKSKSKSKSNSRKKIIKSISNTKINHHKIHINQKNKNLIDNNKIKKNIIFLKKYSNNSTQKYFRYSGSTAFSINDINQLYEKNNLIIHSNNNNNVAISNHSTLEINKLKTPMGGQTTSKKNKFTSQYFNQNEKERYSCSDFTHIKGKDKKCQNICLVKKSNNINTRNNYIDQDGNNVLYSDLSLNRKTTNSSNTFQNNNIIIEKQNNINYTVDLNGYNDLYKNNNNIRYSYTISNEKNTPEKSNNNLIDFGNVNQRNDNSNSNNKYEDKRNTDYIQKDNNLEYIKRIELLENENKVLKGEINESKNKLILLESKINKILFEKSSIEKEECPRPTPYVKKYSMQNLHNNNDDSNNNNINKNENQVEPKKNEKEKTQEDMTKNKSFLNKIQKQIPQPSLNNHQKPKLNKLKKNKSSNFLKNVTKINVNKNYKNIIINNRNEKNKKSKKINNIHKYVEEHIKLFKSTYSNFFFEENIKK